MNQDLIEHLHNLPVPPVIDVLGKWIHCPNARVATTSIDSGVLKDRGILKRRGRVNWELVWKNIILPNIDDVLMFTFVRNSWDRVCSAFYQCRDRARTKENRIDKKWEFKEYVKKVLAVKWPNVNYHFAPQYDTVYFKGELIPNMFVGHYDHLKTDWGMIATRLQVSASLPYWNHAKRDGTYMDHYDEESKEIIAELYAPEIKALGYEFGK